MPTLDIKKLGNLLGKGLLPELAPEIIKGFLIEFFKSKGLDFKEVTRWVENDISLWDSIDPKYQHQIKRVGRLDWLTTQWTINALKDDFPAVASLFLGWKKAHNWLGRQLEEIKQQVRQTAT